MNETSSLENDHIDFINSTEIYQVRQKTGKLDAINHLNRWVPNIFDRKFEKERFNIWSNLTSIREKNPSELVELAKNLKPSITNLTEDPIIANIKNEIDEFDDKLKPIIVMDAVLKDMIFDLILIFKKIVGDYNFFTKLYLNQDNEISNWKEIVFSVRIPENNFEKRIAIWDQLEDEFEETLKALKKNSNDPSQINRLSKIVSIDVERI